MNNNPEDTSFNEVLKKIPSLKAKWIIDAVNALDVASDQIRMQEEPSLAFLHIYHMLTGSDQRRQAHVNRCFQQGMQAIVSQIEDMGKDCRDNTVAINLAADRISNLETHVGTLAGITGETLDNFKRFQQSVEDKFHEVNDRLNRLTARVAANEHYTLVLSAWKAGELDGLSLAGQCYAVAERLYWGDFGQYIRGNGEAAPTLLETVRNEATEILKTRIEKNGWEPRPDIALWLGAGNGSGTESQALTYLSDWATEKAFPFIWTIGQEETRQKQGMPLDIPRLCAPRRLVDAIWRERFPRMEDERC